MVEQGCAPLDKASFWLTIARMPSAGRFDRDDSTILKFPRASIGCLAYNWIFACGNVAVGSAASAKASWCGNVQNCDGGECGQTRAWSRRVAFGQSPHPLLCTLALTNGGDLRVVRREYLRCGGDAAQFQQTTNPKTSARQVAQPHNFTGISRRLLNSTIYRMHVPVKAARAAEAFATIR